MKARLLLAVLGSTSLARAEAPGAEVVVTGERAQPDAPNRAREVAGSVVSGERLRGAALETKDVLRSEPGVQIVELGGLGAPATATLRGATATQTPVYLGGVRLNDEVGGTANLSEVPAFMLERVEVYRSHAPMAADQLSIGGAIFLEPRRLLNGAAFGAMLGSYGSRSVSAYGGVSNASTNLTAGVELVAADNDYPFPSGNGTLFTPRDDRIARLPNADVESQSLWLTGTHDFGATRLRIFYHHAEREQGAPKLALTPSQEARVKLRRDLFALSATLPIEKLNGAVELRSSANVSSTRIDDPLGELSLNRPHLETPGERLEQSVVARQATTSGLRLVEQLTLSEERLRRFEGPSEASEQKLAAQRRQGRFSISSEVPVWGPWLATATLAASCLGTSASGAAGCELEAPSGRVGAGLRARDLELFANAGAYRRPATLSELYGASLLVRGNQRLVPERGETLEAVVRYQLRDGERRVMWLDVSGFARQSHDLITYLRTPQGYFSPVNRNRARFLGSELAVGILPLTWLDLRGNLSLLDARDRSPDRAPSNDILPFLSRLTLGAAISARHELGRRAIDALSLTARLSYQSSRYANPAGQGVIPEQASVDLEAAAFGVGRVLTTRLRVANLFDALRYDIVGFPLPGRSAFISMEIAL